MKKIALIAALVALSTPAYAYLGPGAGLGAVGALVAIVLGVLLLLVGFVWYPIKRMLKKKRASADAAAGQGQPQEK